MQLCESQCMEEKAYILRDVGFTQIPYTLLVVENVAKPVLLHKGKSRNAATNGSPTGTN